MSWTYEARFAGVRLDVRAVSASHGRSVAEHTGPRRDGADLEDLGRDAWRCTLDLVFFDRPGIAEDEGDYMERFQTFQALVEDGTPRTLVTPYEGSRRCRVGPFDHSADADAGPFILATATFIEERATRAIAEAGVGVPVTAGARAVQVAATNAKAAVADLGDDDLLPLVPDDAAAAADAWETDPDTSPRAVQLEVGSLTERLQAELDGFSALDDLELYPVLRAYTLLQDALRRAAEAITQQTTRLVTLNVLAPTPLRMIAAGFYGADQSEQRFAELLELNRFAYPALVPAGSTLVAYAP